MNRKDLANLGLDKDIIDQIMKWNGMDIEREKRKRMETEVNFYETQKYLKGIKQEEKRRKEEISYKEIVEEIIHAEATSNKKMIVAII